MTRAKDVVFHQVDDVGALAAGEFFLGEGVFDADEDGALGGQGVNTSTSQCHRATSCLYGKPKS